MEKEFNLSEKIVPEDRTTPYACHPSFIRTENVKEFIKRLKEKVSLHGEHDSTIDKLAGDKLTKT
jgi:hypothetical protein